MPLLHVQAIAIHFLRNPIILVLLLGLMGFLTLVGYLSLIHI